MSILDLIILECEFGNPISKPESMNKLREEKGKKETNQKILKTDHELTKFFLNSDYERNPQGIIGIKRSDAYMEAIIGAIYLTKGLGESIKFIEVIYGLNIVE